MEGIKKTKIERNKNDMNGSYLVGQIDSQVDASDFGDFDL